MGYNIENGGIYTYHKFQEKRRGVYCLNLKKEESKKQKRCQKLLKQMNKTPPYKQQAKPEQHKSKVEGMCLPKPPSW